MLLSMRSGPITLKTFFKIMSKHGTACISMYFSTVLDTKRGTHLACTLLEGCEEQGYF